MDSPHDTHRWVGCPIRRSRDQGVLAPPPGFSQRATSFIASQRQGIHQMPLLHSPRSSSEPRTRSLHQNETAVPTAKSERRLPKRAYHAQKIAHPEPPATPQKRHATEPDRANSCDHRNRTPSRTPGEPGIPNDDRPRCPRSTRLASSRCRKNNRPPADPARIRKSRTKHVTRPSPAAKAATGQSTHDPGGPGLTRTADLTLIRRAL